MELDCQVFVDPVFDYTAKVLEHSDFWVFLVDVFVSVLIVYDQLSMVFYLKFWDFWRYSAQEQERVQMVQAHRGQDMESFVFVVESKWAAKAKWHKVEVLALVLVVSGFVAVGARALSVSEHQRTD